MAVCPLSVWLFNNLLTNSVGEKIQNESRRLIVLGFNDTSTLVGHFVSSPREREKREEIVEKMKERDREEKEQERKWWNRRNKNIPPLHLPAQL